MIEFLFNDVLSAFQHPLTYCAYISNYTDILYVWFPTSAYFKSCICYLQKYVQLNLENMNRRFRCFLKYTVFLKNFSIFLVDYIVLSKQNHQSHAIKLDKYMYIFNDNTCKWFPTPDSLEFVKWTSAVTDFKHGNMVFITFIFIVFIPKAFYDFYKIMYPDLFRRRYYV